MTARQRRLPLVLVICAVLAVFAIEAMAGIPGTGQPPTAQPSAAPLPASSFTNPTPRIAIVYDAGGRGGSGFSELAWEGVTRAAAAFDAELTEVTAGPDDTEADREARLTELADARNHPIFVVGPSHAAAVTKVARKYPGFWFGVLDNGSVNAPNVIGIQFNEEQGAFLVGAAAALTSRSGNVGFIGAAPVPPFQKYEAGFTAGARAVDPDVRVQVAYLARPSDETGASDPATARAAALRMYDAGADVVFGAAGDAGGGVIQAAHERGLWAIGADSDPYPASDPSLRGSILTSMLKRADVAAYTITMEIATGVPKDGNNVFGLDRDGVGYSTSGGFVGAIRAQLDAFAARIAAGEILVPTTP